MGQFYMIVNIDKGEFLDPEGLFGFEAKFWNVANGYCMTGLAILLARGYSKKGTWFGDRIAIVEDGGYYPATELVKPYLDAAGAPDDSPGRKKKLLYNAAMYGKDITCEILEYFKNETEFVIDEGWPEHYVPRIERVCENNDSDD